MKATPSTQASRPPRAFPRRRFLRGLAGAAVALPFLDSLGRDAHALPFPKRLVIVFTPNGTIEGSFYPTGSEYDFTLGEILQPLAPHVASLLVLKGIDVESSYHGPGDDSHMNAMGHMLTATSLIDVGNGVYWGGGISVDQFIAQQIGGATKLASLELAVENNAATIDSRMSYLGPLQPVPPEPDPAKAYQRAFGEVPPELLAKRKSVLDAVAGDLESVEARLGADDRKKLDAHLTAVRETEKRLFVVPPQACGSLELARLDLRDMPAIGKQQMDLLTLALACDVTRVVTLQWSQAVSMTTMSWLGIAEPHHTLSHNPVFDLVSQQKLVTINHWYAQQFAYLLAAMKAVPEGDGTLLDHSLVVWCNELSDGQLHSRRHVPYVLAGGASGAMKMGRYLTYGSTSGAPWHSDLLVSICQAMDVDVQTFGDPAYCHGPLAKLTG